MNIFSGREIETVKKLPELKGGSVDLPLKPYGAEFVPSERDKEKNVLGRRKIKKKPSMWQTFFLRLVNVLGRKRKIPLSRGGGRRKLVRLILFMGKKGSPVGGRRGEFLPRGEKASRIPSGVRAVRTRKRSAGGKL